MRIVESPNDCGVARTNRGLLRAKTGSYFMRTFFEVIAPWVFILIMSVPALWVFYDMVKDAVAALRNK